MNFQTHVIFPMKMCHIVHDDRHVLRVKPIVLARRFSSMLLQLIESPQIESVASAFFFKARRILPVSLFFFLVKKGLLQASSYPNCFACCITISSCQGNGIDERVCKQSSSAFGFCSRWRFRTLEISYRIDRNKGSEVHGLSCLALNRSTSTTPHIAIADWGEPSTCNRKPYDRPLNIGGYASSAIGRVSC